MVGAERTRTGRHGGCWFYFHYLPKGRAALRLAAQGVPAIERMIAPLAYPFMRRYAAWLLQVDASTVDAGLGRSRAIVAQTDALLADGRPYLAGDRFSAADLALACMMVPFLVPEEYGIRLPRPADLPAPMRLTVQAFRSTTTGRYVLKLFQTQRSPER